MFQPWPLSNDILWGLQCYDVGSSLIQPLTTAISNDLYVIASLRNTAKYDHTS